MLHRFIVGETTPASVAQALTDLGVQSATLVPALGLWEGATESSVVVDIYGPVPRSLAEDLRLRCRQDAVLYSEIPCHWRLADARP